MFNMEDIYARLQKGEKIEDIGNEIAAMMTEAQNRYDSEQAAIADTEAAKRELVEELVEIVQELAILEGMDPDEVKVTDEDVDQLVAAFTEVFKAMHAVKVAFAEIETSTAKKPVKVTVKTSNIDRTDDQILADFLKLFN